MGSVVTQHFIATGAVLTAWDIVQSRMAALHERLHFDIVDISDEDEVEHAFERAVLTPGGVLVCVALAGLDFSFIQDHQSICDVPLIQWHKIIEINHLSSHQILFDALDLLRPFHVPVVRTFCFRRLQPSEILLVSLRLRFVKRQSNRPDPTQTSDWKLLDCSGLAA